MKRILLLCLILLPVLLQAQQPLPGIPQLNKDSLLRGSVVYLEDKWKFHAGDDTLWAAGEYDDRGWKEKADAYMNMQHAGDKKIGFKGKGWFRYHFMTDTTLNRCPLALQMDQGGASQIYLDGKLIKQYGSFRSAGKSLYLNPKSEPAIFLIPEAGAHLLAVRYENYDAWKRLAKYDEEMGGFALSLTTAEQSVHVYRSTVKTVFSFCLTSGCIFLTLFVVHLILFLFYRSDKSNLYFSLFNLGCASFIFLLFFGLMAARVAYTDQLSLWLNASLSVACFAVSALVNNLFSKRKLRFRIIALLCLVSVLCPFVLYKASAYLLGLVALVCALEATILVCIAMYRKIKGARIIGTGILFFVLFVATVMVVSMANNGIQLQGGYLTLLLLLLTIMAVFSIPFSMSAYLAWNVASLNRNLQVQLEQVEMLSHKTLLQEQEKQQMLENRQEELEREVVHRTTEVLEQKQQIELQHQALKAEKKKSDDLLLNILPAEVAEELKENGETKAKHFDHVSVLFTDFVNFTHIAEQLSPEQLVQELHACFRAFDDIIERNGMEKIKTIGDAYLAVSGMPVNDERHASNAVKAGLEIVAFINSRRHSEHAFDVRVGINSGSLVAGIVGVKKFAYDIWGDTVNMASRMESNSESGKVNISESTYELVKEEFTCRYRGKINAKNKGEVDMYFVEKKNTGVV